MIKNLTAKSAKRAKVFEGLLSGFCVLCGLKGNDV